MDRLTEKDERGNWCLKGLSRWALQGGEALSKKSVELLYGALYKLMKYEDTGLTPEDVERLNDFEQSQMAELLKRLAEERRKHRWIPVEEQLPDNDSYILMSFENFSMSLIGRYETDETGGAFYVGDDEESCISQDLFVNAWMLLPEPYRPEVLPSGPATDPAV